jgi:hypothetical protein
MHFRRSFPFVSQLIFHTFIEYKRIPPIGIRVRGGVAAFEYPSFIGMLGGNEHPMTRSREMMEGGERESDLTVTGTSQSTHLPQICNSLSHPIQISVF